MLKEKKSKKPRKIESIQDIARDILSIFHAFISYNTSYNVLTISILLLLQRLKTLNYSTQIFSRYYYKIFFIEKMQVILYGNYMFMIGKLFKYDWKFSFPDFFKVKIHINGKI